MNDIFRNLIFRVDFLYCNRVQDIRKHKEQNGVAIIVQIWTKKKYCICKNTIGLRSVYE